jgi:hypothetical protein
MKEERREEKRKERGAREATRPPDKKHQTADVSRCCNPARLLLHA